MEEKIRTLLLILGSCSVAIGTASAAPATEGTASELLIPVTDQKTLDKFHRKTAFSFREHVYSAKRYRIVKVNFDVLKKDEPIEFIITPFSDLSMKVRGRITTSYSATIEGEPTISFKGELVTPEMSSYEIAQGSREGVRGPPVFLNLSDRPYPVEPELIAEIKKEMKIRDEEPQLVSPVPNNPPRQKPRLKVKSISGTWAIPQPGGAPLIHVSIAPLGDDPRYHLFMVFDSNKISTGGPEDVAKQKRHNEFVKKLHVEKKLYEESKSSGEKKAQ